MHAVSRRIACSGGIAVMLGAIVPAHAVAAPEQSSLLQKVAQMGERFRWEGNRLHLEASTGELRHRHGFSSAEIHELRAVLRRANDTSRASAPGMDEVVAAGRLLYLSHSDLTVGTAAALTAAAEVGPAALAAAWATFSAAFSGPLGFATAVLGGAYFADFAVKILQAVASGKGIGIYSQFGLPPLRVEVE